MNGKRRIRGISLVLFSIGIIFGLTFLMAAVWGDLEASIFDPAFSEGNALRSLSCPLVISASEVGRVRASVPNPLDRPMQRLIRVHISHGYVTLMRDIRERFIVQPGETHHLEWTVTAEDAAFGRLILVKAYLAGRYPLPARIGSCGILVLHLPGIPGDLLVALVTAGSLASMATGALLWRLSGPTPERGKISLARSLTILGATLLVGMTFAYTGFWVLGLIVLVIILLTILGMVVHYMVP